MTDRITAEEYRELMGLPPVSQLPGRMSAEEYRKTNATVPPRRERKYGNVPVLDQGLKFDSGAERRRYYELRLLEREGVISDIELQPRFVLLEGYSDGNGKWNRPVTYTADFRYTEAGKIIVEDVKSPVTRKEKAYRIKVKLLRRTHPNIEFREVER